MDHQLLGIHHVTAIAGNLQGNFDFYTEVLGQRLVKLTVNFDDPGTYHFYYGDRVGHPGTILTFFPWPHGIKGRRGAGQLTSLAYSIPQGSIGYWIERFKQFGIPMEAPYTRFNEEVLTFYDPDGLQVELAANDENNSEWTWEDGPIPAEHALRGIYSVTLTEKSLEKTANLLDEGMDFRSAGEAFNRCRFEVGEGPEKARVDLLYSPEETEGHVSVGTVHHIAWRTPNDAEQLQWQSHLSDFGMHVTRVMDRQYFHSIYYREPGGVLFEIATDPPGFTLDEPVESLGMNLKLPPWLEAQRSQIEEFLPPIQR